MFTDLRKAPRILLKNILYKLMWPQIRSQINSVAADDVARKRRKKMDKGRKGATTNHFLTKQVRINTADEGNLWKSNNRAIESSQLINTVNRFLLSEVTRQSDVA